MRAQSIIRDNTSLMSGMSEQDLLLIKEFIVRLGKRHDVKEESYNPYKPLTREEIIERLQVARQHADDGKVMQAQQASHNVREKYGL